MYPIINTGVFTSLDVMAILQNIQATQWTGNTYYVDPVNGLDLNNGTSPNNVQGEIGNGPVQSLTAGHALLVSGNADTLVIMTNGLTSGAVRVNTAFTWTVSGCRVIGITPPGRISQRARFAPLGTVTAFANFFTITGSGNYFANIDFFQGFNTGVAAEICMTISGGRNVFQNCSFQGMGDATGAGSSTSRNILFTANGTECLFQNCQIGIDTVSRGVANASVEFSGGCNRNIFENCVFPIDASASTVLGILTASAASIDRFQLFNQCLFINAISSGGTAMTGLATLAASSGGMIIFKNSTLVGISSFGTGAGSKTQIYVDGAAVSSSTGIAVNPA